MLATGVGAGRCARAPASPAHASRSTIVDAVSGDDEVRDISVQWRWNPERRRLSGATGVVVHWLGTVSRPSSKRWLPPRVEARERNLIVEDAADVPRPRPLRETDDPPFVDRRRPRRAVAGLQAVLQDRWVHRARAAAAGPRGGGVVVHDAVVVVRSAIERER